MPETAYLLFGICLGFMIREYLSLRLPPTVSERERGHSQATETADKSAKTKGE